MSETKSQSDDGRTETERFTNGVSGEKLIVGDRIDTRLVARTFGQLGTRIKPSHPNEEPEPKTQLVQITRTNDMDDVHRALLADTETGTIIYASRHDSQSAWSQKEADWTVHEVGTSVTVGDDVDLTVADQDDEPEDKQKYVQHWVDIVIKDTANGYDDYSDERELVGGSTLKLRDMDGREAYASITLEGTDQ
jgi:hypothetical protein